MNDPNKNKPGFKNTKVGWIPEEWKTGCVHHFGNIYTGNTPTKNDTTNYGDYMPWCTAVDMAHKYVESTVIRLSEQGSKKARIVPMGSVLVTCIASIGRNSIAAIELATNQQINAVVPSGNACGEYFYYAICASKNRMLRCAGHTAVSILNKSDFKNLPLVFPPLPEQEKIAKILATWDKALEQARKLIEAKKRRKKALMQQLLTGKKRLPGFAEAKGYVPYQFFDLPKDWECPHIREIASERSDRSGQTRTALVLSCSKYRGLVSSAEYFGKQVFSEDTSNYKVMRKGWFGFPANHIEEGSIGLLQDFDVGIVSPIYVVFSVCDRVLPEYMYAVFKTEAFRHTFAISTNASVDRRGSLRWREFGLIRVPLPSLAEQEAIAAVLRTSDEEIAGLETELNTLEKQKRGLMQKLLTGAVRVKV